MPGPNNLTLMHLRDCYRQGLTTPRDVILDLLAAIPTDDSRNVWITRLSREQILAHVEALDPAAIDRLPLYGIPFVVKDNIDLAGVPTTAGCPAFAYTPARSATVVQRLIDAGAIPLGKTNLDQFATGLVGTRSPYGACGNSFDPNFISGGSSSGSAVAVALGFASFSLGTDTAGSGRVPAAFNNIIGLKPSLGRLSTRGVVPACRSIDCVSVFALTAEDAAIVLKAAEGFDADDGYSREPLNRPLEGRRCGLPRRDQLQFFADADAADLFDQAILRLTDLGASVHEIDFEPFFETARLLYEGPWIAERYAAVGSFIDAHRDAVLPITRSIIESGGRQSAAQAFEGQYRLKELERRCARAWNLVDFIVTPTAGTIYRREAVQADPLRLNANLGLYTNFMNLLDLAGVAVPGGFRSDGMPFGVTVVGPRGTDHDLLILAGRLHRASVTTLGATGITLPAAAPPAAAPRGAPAMVLPWGHIAVAVCGAHMDGLPLNHQLLDRGGYRLQITRSAACYRLFALPGGPPERPGMVRVGADGSHIELEVWALPTIHLGSFLAGIPAPLGLGTVELESGTSVLGFLCESHATERATDITAMGGWRTYLRGHWISPPHSGTVT